MLLSLVLDPYCIALVSLSCSTREPRMRKAFHHELRGWMSSPAGPLVGDPETEMRVPTTLVEASFAGPSARAGDAAGAAFVLAVDDESAMELPALALFESALLAIAELGDFGGGSSSSTFASACSTL